MKRKHLLGLVAGAAMLAIPAVAVAQQPPSPPVALYYGTVEDAAIGQTLSAYIVTGNSTATCGGTLVQDDDGPVYAVDVVSDAQTSGCGQSGRVVRFYLAPFGETDARVLNTTATLGSSFAAVNLDLSGGNDLTFRYYSPVTASDKVQP